MTNTVILKRSSVANAVPTVANLTEGELALNYTDGNLFYKTAGNTISVIASNKFLSVTGNITGGNVITSGIVTATGNIKSSANVIANGIITSNDNLIINSTGIEGGQLVIGWANIGSLTGQANSTWNIDVDSSNNFRTFYQNAAGATSVLIQASPSSNIVSFPSTAGISATGNITGSYFIGNGSQLTGITVAAGSSIVNGTSNLVVQSSSNIVANVNGSWATSITSTGILANTVWANSNGAGTNFRVGDDTWIGDINIADTMSIRGQQNAANAYIVFGNADSTGKLGRAGSGPLSYAGAFSASGNITGNYILGNGSQLTGINSNVTVGGSNTNVQFNDNGVLGGDSKLTFNKTTGTLSATSIVFPDAVGNTVGFTAPANVTSPTTWKLPPADGTIYGNVLATDTTGNLMWRGFSSTVFVYTRTSTVAVSAVNGYVNILGRTGNIYVSIT